MTTRNSIKDFQLANPMYKGASVSFYTVADGEATSTLATLYEGLTGSQTLSNPQTLDARGKFKQPVYIQVPVVAVIDGIGFASHSTGVIRPYIEDLGTMASQEASAVAITGGTIAGCAISASTVAALTSFGIRSTGAAFDLKFASSEVLTADRTVTWNVGNAARSITINGNLSFGGAVTTAGALTTAGSVAFAGQFATFGPYLMYIVATDDTVITLPTSGTLATLANSETLTNKTLTSPTINGGAMSGTFSGAHTYSGLVTMSAGGKAATTFGVGGATPSASGSGVSFPSTQSASTDPNTLDDYVEGSFTGTLTGCTTSPTNSLKVTKIGNVVTLDSIASFTGTSNATTKTVTGMSAAYRPTTKKSFFVRLSDNGGANVVGLMEIETSGVLSFYIDPYGTAWTGSGTATIGVFCVTYTLN